MGVKIAVSIWQKKISNFHKKNLIPSYHRILPPPSSSRQLKFSLIIGTQAKAHASGMLAEHKIWRVTDGIFIVNTKIFHRKIFFISSKKKNAKNSAHDLLEGTQKSSNNNFPRSVVVLHNNTITKVIRRKNY